MADDKKAAHSSESQTQSDPGLEKVKARVTALEWNTTHPVTGKPIKLRRGHVVFVTRQLFDSVNDSFRPSLEELTEE